MKQDLREGRDALQIEEATYEEHLDMVARAARMSTMHIDRNPKYGSSCMDDCKGMQKVVKKGSSLSER